MSFFEDPLYYGLIIKLLLVYAFGGYLVFSKLLDYSTSFENKLFLLVSSMGLSLYLFVLILNYLLFVFCGYSDFFYLICLLLFFLLCFFLSRKNFGISYAFILNQVKPTKKIVQVFLMVGGLLIFSGWSYYIHIKKITEHDTLEYATQGKIFYKDKCIKYSSVRYDNESFFYYVGLHGFSFPLIRTFEMLTNKVIDSGDLFFRSVNSVYGGLIVLLVFSFFYRAMNVRYALIVVSLLLMNYGFFETIMKYHIDNFRVFFFLISVVFMHHLIGHFDKRLFFLFGIFLGAQSNAHSLGFMIAIIQLLTFFIFSNIETKNKTIYTIYVFLIMLFMGGWHYIVDTFFGTGWIFKDIKFF